MLKTPDLGSLDYGTPIYFRRLQVGEVASYELDKDGQSLTVKVFVNAPYDQYVTPEHALLARERDRRVALRDRPQRPDAVAALHPGRRRRLRDARDRSGAAAGRGGHASSPCSATGREAFKPPPRDPQTYVLVFTQSVRGLAPGAPVEFRGIPIGEVAEIRAQFDAKTFEFSVPVTIRLDPTRCSGVKIVDQARRARPRRRTAGS